MTTENQGILVYAPTQADDVVLPKNSKLRVSTRINWTDPWSVVPYLEPLKGTNTLAPGKGVATFLWRYGEIKREDKTTFTDYVPKDLFGSYVRVEAFSEDGSETQWYGRLEDDELDVHGAVTKPQGDQEIKALGLENDLDRYDLKQVKCRQNGSSFAQKSIPVFNRRAGRGPGLLGNRSLSRQTGNVYEFSSDGELWTNKDIAESVLAWNVPADGTPFQLAGQVEELDKIVQTHRFPAGVTLRQILCQLIDPRRGLGWCVRVDGEDNVLIWIFSVLEDDVGVGGQTAVSNNEQFSVILDDAIDFEKVLVTLHKSTKYDSVRMRGARMKSIFSISFADLTWEEGFTAALLTAFKQGQSSAPDYPADLQGQAERNDQYRGDDRFERLSVFRIPPDWDLLAGDGVGGAKSIVLPAIGDDGEIDTDTSQDLFMFGQALLHHLPGLEVGKDYSVSPALDENPSDADPEFRRPFALIKYDGKWMYLDKLSESIGGQVVTNAQIRMMDRELAVQVLMRPKWMLFGNDWSGAEPSLLAGQVWTATQVADGNFFDYNDMLATVAIQGDQYVQVVAGGGPGADEYKELMIEVPDAELVYLVPGTVLGIDNEGNLKHAAGGVLLVDDRDRLRRLAAVAWSWYHKARASVRLVNKSRFRLIQVGQLMKSVRSASDFREVGTVVSQEHFDWQTGKVTYTTQYGEMTFSGFSPEFPDNRTVSRELLELRKESKELSDRTGGLPARIGSAMVLAAATIIGVTGVAQATAASPDAIVTGDITNSFYSRTDTKDQFSETSKIILKLERPILRQNAGRYNRLLLSGANVFSELLLGSNESNWTMSSNYRVTPIIADFDLATETSWNALSGLSLGASVDAQVFRSYADTTTAVDYCRFEKASSLQTLLFTLAASEPMYGFILEVKLATTAVAAISAAIAWLNLNILGGEASICFALEDQPYYSDGTSP